jgi:hypothetical protein
MKRCAVIFSLIFTVLAFASCAVKGGTIEVTNGSDFTASIVIHKGAVPVTTAETAAPGKKVTFSIDEDGTYNVEAAFFSGSASIGHKTQGGIVLSGGTTKTVNVKPE